MKNILGLGPYGHNAVKQLKNKEQYTVYTVSTKNSRNTKYNFKLPVLESPELYESSDLKSLHNFLKKIKGNVTVFLSGASPESGLTLRALELLHKENVKIEIVYFMPEREILSKPLRLQERLVRNVLQQYCRSGLFECMTLVSGELLEPLAASTSVLDYFDEINRVFCDSYYMIDVFKNSRPITSTYSKQLESCRIKTVGISSLEEKDYLFFDFKDTVEVVYYFGINEDKLKNDEGLFRKITNKIKKIANDQTRVSFGIYSTKYQDDYMYVEYFSPKVQNSLDETQSV